eukprot:6175058-Pleurochrysis_carterae.AAC.1
MEGSSRVIKELEWKRERAFSKRERDENVRNIYTRLPVTCMIHGCTDRKWRDPQKPMKADGAS